MPRRDFSKVAFAATGDVNTIPSTVQPDGSISLPSGWGFDYERDNGAGGGTPDPLAKNIDREDMNGILNEITASIGEIQQSGFPSWASTAAPYPVLAYTRYNNVVWQSQVANNSDTPGVGAGATSWKDVNLPIQGKLIGFQRITASGTYTPTAGMKNVFVRAIGGGGGSGGAPAMGASGVVATGGGASGSYLEAWLTAATIGASQSVLIGSGGSAGVAAGGGGAGGPTSLGALLLAPGGAGSAAGSAVLNTQSSVASGGVPGGISSGGNILNSSGVQGLPGITLLASVLAGAGASTQFGAGGYQAATPQPGAGYGSGASGVASTPSAAAKVGAAGAPGVMIFMEFS